MSLLEDWLSDLSELVGNLQTLFAEGVHEGALFNDNAWREDSLEARYGVRR